MRKIPGMRLFNNSTALRFIVRLIVILISAHPVVWLTYGGWLEWVLVGQVHSHLPHSTFIRSCRKIRCRISLATTLCWTYVCICVCASCPCMWQMVAIGLPYKACDHFLHSLWRDDWTCLEIKHLAQEPKWMLSGTVNCTSITHRHMVQNTMLLSHIHSTNALPWSIVVQEPNLNLLPPKIVPLYIQE